MYCIIIRARTGIVLYGIMVVRATIYCTVSGISIGGVTTVILGSTPPGRAACSIGEGKLGSALASLRGGRGGGAPRTVGGVVGRSRGRRYKVA